MRATSLAVLAAFVAQAAFPALAQDAGTVTADIGGQTVSWSVEIADDGPERSKGLMFRRSLAPGTGMLFDFSVTRPVSMWMRNTYVPLDMIFICEDGTVANIGADTTPLSEATVSSDGPVRYVLEINAGRAAELSVVPGTRLQHPSFASDPQADCKAGT